MIPITHIEAVKQLCCKNPTICCAGHGCIAWQQYYTTAEAEPAVPAPKKWGVPPMRPVPLSRSVDTGRGYCAWLGYE